MLSPGMDTEITNRRSGMENLAGMRGSCSWNDVGNGDDAHPRVFRRYEDVTPTGGRFASLPSIGIQGSLILPFNLAHHRIAGASALAIVSALRRCDTSSRRLRPPPLPHPNPTLYACVDRRMCSRGIFYGQAAFVLLFNTYPQLNTCLIVYYNCSRSRVPPDSHIPRFFAHSYYYNDN
jgi:hypothetical protein